MAHLIQRVIWTALPTGRNDHFLTLTALASPRLIVRNAPMEFLDKWPDFLSWATRVEGARFVVKFGGVQLDAEPVSKPDPAVWRALFTPKLVVRTHHFEDKRGARILSYPVAAVHDYVDSVYGDLGLKAIDELPDKRQLLASVIDIAKPFEAQGSLQAWVLGKLGDDASRRSLTSPQGSFILQEVYHMPLAARDLTAGQHMADGLREYAQWRQHRFTQLPASGDFSGLIDFHAAVSALNQYPRLMRLAGLAVDLRIRAETIPSGPFTDQLSLKVDWKPSPEAETGVETLADGMPMTITRLDEAVFAPAIRSLTTPFSEGLLAINHERFRLIQMDVDGAGIKLRNMARSFLRSTAATRRDEDPDRAGAPALRTAGLQLVEIERHLSLEKAFTRSGEMNDALTNSAPIKLFGEDLTRGYHADIMDQTLSGPWRSLCRRDGLYSLLNSGEMLRVADEEGILRLGAQEAADPADPQFKKLVKISELIFSWSGWSLTAPRPGLAIGTDDTVQSSQNVAPTGLPLETVFRVHPGSLPALRFGHEYRARVRLVDLAGNALPFKDNDTAIPNGASNPQIFRRFEPVPPPVNALVEGPGGLEQPGDGESMARMAIRSFNPDAGDNGVPTKAEARRHVVPPRTSHLMAEMHGLLDDTPGHPDETLYGLLAARDENLDEAVVLHEDPLTGSRDEIKYSFGPEKFKLPYLPDALAKLTAVRLDLDPKSQPTARFELPYFDGTRWPEALPFKIRIFEDATASIQFEPSTRTLHVPLAKAEMMRVRISHCLSNKDLELLAVWDMMKRQPGMNAKLEPKLRDMAKSGGHWMLTPWLDMELVHAVQKPLVCPAFLNLGASRNLGETTAQVHFRSPIHAKSTDKTELLGRWQEPSDIPAEGAPRVLNQSGTAFETRLTRSSFPGSEIKTSGPHSFADTHYRRVIYWLEAPTRFREFMPAAVRSQPELMKVVSKPGIAFVPNSSPPPAPEILEITPTFGWSRTRHSDRIVSFRSGGGLRVWLKRPWFSSGFGEMLGVVVASTETPNAEITGPKAKFVTQWGVDPIWRSGTINSASPPVSAFPMRLTGGPIPADRSPDFVPEDERNLPNPFQHLTDLELPESGGTHVNVAAHPVSYDSQRALYFCDIILKHGTAYFPFVRLALARYHPVSCLGAHLSPAVIGDYTQLAPDRLLLLSKGDKAGTLKLQLFGHSFTHSPLTEERPKVDGRPVIRMEIQKKDPNLTGDIAWQRADSPAVDPLVLHPVIPLEKAPTLEFDLEEFRGRASRPMIADLDVFVQLSPPLMWETVFTPALPEPGEKCRIMVMEYERHMVDDDRSPLEKTSPDPALRLVYAEAIEL